MEEESTADDKFILCFEKFNAFLLFFVTGNICSLLNALELSAFSALIGTHHKLFSKEFSLEGSLSLPYKFYFYINN
jgi:hypothetical protein